MNDDQQKLIAALRDLDRALRQVWEPPVRRLVVWLSERLPTPSKVTLAERWAVATVHDWEDTIERLSRLQTPSPYHVDQLARAKRAHAAALRQLEVARSGAWPDDDRAARSDGKTKTTPG